MAAIMYSNKDITSFRHPWCKKEALMEAYNTIVCLMNMPDMWPQSNFTLLHLLDNTNKLEDKKTYKKRNYLLFVEQNCRG